MTPTEANASLVDLVRNRTERMTLGGCGIRLAADYVRGVLIAAGMDGAVMFPGAPNLLKEAETRLVYRNDEMAYEPPMTSMPAIETYCKSVGVDVPPRTLMVFENIVSTSQEDRDGDVLCSEGAIIDPKMPLLWHHMLPAIVGKMLCVREQNAKHVRVASAVMESPLGQDVANLIEFGALRISHGFRPLEFAPRERDKGLRDQRTGPRGFRISSFECLEESTVSVPSNVGAEIIAWSRGKVHTPLVKSWCKSLYEQRDKVFQSGAVQKISIPIELKIDVRPTFAEGGVVGAHVIQPAGPEVIVPDYSIGERPPQEGETFTEKRSNTELSQQEVRDFIRSLQPGDLVAVEEKTEADVAQDSQAVYRGWNGRVEEVSPDYAEVAIVKTDGSPARIEASGRYRALVRQPEPKPEASALDMLRIEPQPKGTEVTTPSDAPQMGKLLPGEIAARQVDPNKFEKFRRENDKFGAGIHAIWGITADGKTEVQSIRFDSSKFTEDEAKAWLEKHGFKTTIEPAAKPEEKTMSTETKTAADASETIAKAAPPAEPDGEAEKCPECGKPVVADEEGKCPDCGAKMEEATDDDAEKAATVDTKAGRTLSAANEEKLRTAMDALKQILEQVEPPAPVGDYKPVAEPTAPEGNQPAKPVETTANKPTPVDLYKPDGSLSLQASAQAIVRRMLDPMDASDIRAVGKLAEASILNRERNVIIGNTHCFIIHMDYVS